MKGSAQYQLYREALLNFNQTSQSSINPKNYFTSKRKSPKTLPKQQYGSGRRKATSRSRAANMRSHNGNTDCLETNDRSFQPGLRSYAIQDAPGQRVPSATRGAPRGSSQQHSASQHAPVPPTQMSSVLDYSGKVSSQ